MWIYFGLWPRPALALAVSLFFCCLFDYYIVYPGMRQPVKWLFADRQGECFSIPKSGGMPSEQITAGCLLILEYIIRFILDVGSPKSGR